MAYCEEEVECRRVMILTHFGETSFHSAQCKGTCDLCARNQSKTFEKRDMTSAAQDAVKVWPPLCLMVVFAAVSCSKQRLSPAVHEVAPLTQALHRK